MVITHYLWKQKKVIPVVPPLSPIEVTVPKFEVYPAGLDELYGV
jgi:hypothetical protein